jgi:hypothetical protein
VTRAVGAADGKVEAFYFAYGQDDTIIIADYPDAASATAISLVGNSTGVVRVSMTLLITVEEMDRAVDKAATLPSPEPTRDLRPHSRGGSGPTPAGFLQFDLCRVRFPFLKQAHSRPHGRTVRSAGKPAFAPAQRKVMRGALRKRPRPAIAPLRFWSRDAA